MDIKQHVPLSEYSTMKLGGSASYLLEVKDSATLVEAIETAKRHAIDIIMIGGGSNIIWRDEGFNGLVLVNKINGFEITSQDDAIAYITVGAGEAWDSVVQRCVDLGLSGIECLSLIPGTAGATPIQNVGAYGQDISQVLMTLTAYDSKEARMVTLKGSDCQFSYRKSIFNTSEKGRYFITAITMLLSKAAPLPPFYASLESYLEAHKISSYSSSSIREAVISIRKTRLPDPAIIPNTGSFFANPIVDSTTFMELAENYPSLPNWPADNGQVKVSAAWLISQLGYNDFYDAETGMATWEAQPLVFINRSAKTTADLLLFANRIKTKVSEEFGIELSQEPQLIP